VVGASSINGEPGQNVTKERVPHGTMMIRLCRF
jgi:hypothetical protein